VEKEQKLIESHNCPPLLKKWLEDVLTYNWAYGSGGDKLLESKKKITAKQEDISTHQILVPFEISKRSISCS
jgi:putative NADPH-quinone reductase